MKRTYMLAAAAVTCLAISGSAQAGPGGKGNSGGSKGISGSFKPTGGSIKATSATSSTFGGFKSTSGFKTTIGTSNLTPLKAKHSPIITTGTAFKKTSGYHLTFGKSFSHGFCYHGKHHCHWSYSCFWPKYGCNAHWCPSACCYYYWCEPACCYYPISYIAIAPPTLVTVTVPVAVPVTLTLPAASAPVQYASQGPISGPPAGIPELPQ